MSDISGVPSSAGNPSSGEVMSGATDLYYRLTVGTPLSSKLLSYSVLVSKPYQDNDRSIKPDQMGPADPWDNEHLGWPPKPHLDATKPVSCSLARSMHGGFHSVVDEIGDAATLILRFPAVPPPNFPLPWPSKGWRTCGVSPPVNLLHGAFGYNFFCHGNYFLRPAFG